MGVFTPTGTEPYIVSKGPFRPGGALHITTSSTHRPYENGLAERNTAHSRSELPHSWPVQASGGGHAFAYAQAARIENLLTTTIPVPRTRDTLAASLREGARFRYDSKERRQYPFGALAFPSPLPPERGNSLSRNAGLCMGEPTSQIATTSWPSRIVMW